MWKWHRFSHFFQPNSDFFATGSSFRDGKHTKMIVRSWRIERKKNHCSPIISRRAGGFGRLRKAKPRKVRFFQTPLPGHWIDELNNWKDRNVHRYRCVGTELFPGHSKFFFTRHTKLYAFCPLSTLGVFCWGIFITKIKVFEKVPKQMFLKIKFATFWCIENWFSWILKISVFGS